MNRTFMRVEEKVRKHGSLLAAVAHEKKGAGLPKPIRRKLASGCMRITRFNRVGIGASEVVCVLAAKHEGICSWEAWL